jgi:hypothetical protein
MARAIHVNGECAVRTGTGAANALEDLGVTVDGADIDVMDHTVPIHTDTNGGPQGPPFDELYLPQDAEVTMQLVFFDEAVLAKIRFRVQGTDGLMGPAGKLWGGASNYFRLLLTSPIDTTPHNFPSARLTKSFSAKLGNRQTIWNLTFYCLAYTGSAGSTAGNTLYNTSTA